MKLVVKVVIVYNIRGKKQKKKKGSSSSNNRMSTSEDEDDRKMFGQVAWSEVKEEYI